MTLVTDMRLDARLFAEPGPRRPGRPGRPAERGPRLPAMVSLVTAPEVEWRGSTAAARRGVGGERALDYATGRAIWHKPGEPAALLRWVSVSDPVKGPGEEGYLKLLVASDPAVEAEAVIRYYARRWSCEVTVAEVRRHLGVETQRQWSALAIARATPCAMALAPIACLVAHDLGLAVRPRGAAWYNKPHVTFSDALTAVREHLWPLWITCTSRSGPEVTDSWPRAADMTAVVRHLAHALMRCAA